MTNKLLLGVAMTAALLLSTPECSAVLVLIDFGPAATITPGNWNNYTSPDESGEPITNLIDQTGASTGIGLEFVANVGGSGVSNQNYSVSTGDAANLPMTAVQDLFFYSGPTGEQSGTYRLTNLQPGIPYTISAFAGLPQTRDDTLVTVTGDSGPIEMLIDPSFNDSYLVFEDVIPAADSTISLKISESDPSGLASGAYINALIIDLGSELPDVTDFNNDTFTNLLDFNILRSNYLTGTSESQGDANHDGVVNHQDFYLWRTVFLNSGGSPAAIVWSPVPEPTAALTASVLGLAVCSFRRRLR